MTQKNLFNKKFNKSVLSITNRIESFFNFFREKIRYKKKFLTDFKAIDKKIFFAAAIIFIMIIGYFLIPTFYDKNKIKVQIENQILSQYNLKVELDETLTYRLFPKPHFYSKNTIINYESSNIAKSKNTKVFISIKNFFSRNSLEVKNLIFKKTEFKINSTNIDFFINLMNFNSYNKDLKFLNSKLFYLDESDDVIFFTNIKSLNYLYQNDFLQKLNSKLNIFNIPITLDMVHDVVEKKVLFEIKSHPLRLSVENYSSYKDEKLYGILDLKLINKSKKIKYNLENDLLNFNIDNNDINGNIQIKPFFLSSNLNFSLIDLKKIFKDNSVLINVLKTEILNNKNLNGKISVNTNSFKGLNLLNDISFTILLEQGDIILQNLETTFKNSVIVKLSDTQLIVDNNNLNFAGYITLDFIDIDDFYTHYQINKKDRKEIKKINFGYLFNLEEKFIEIDNLKIDGKSSQYLNGFLNNLNSKKENIFNKIIFRNSIKDFFRNL